MGTPDLIDTLKRQYAVFDTAIRLFDDPDALAKMAAVRLLTAERVVVHRGDKTVYEKLDFFVALREYRANPDIKQMMLQYYVAGMISWIRHAVLEGDSSTGSEAMQFFRHLRNAVSHGNTWSFDSRTLRRLEESPVRFRGFTIDHTLQGEPVLFKFMDLGDIFELLDEIRTELQSEQ